MKSSIIALIVSVFGLQSVFASASSAVTYHGKVVNEADTPIPFVTIVALTPSDSAYVTGAMTDDSGQFSFCPLSSGLCY
ncbi:MAG: carboxypeptidase-like regulatory domain-containing protein [Porphyromonadaceae bacterium]|nr:MAG: carboxypeptidase-like regulatory domain-containing protein [Porphyromonadaceae bacterium]